MPKCPICTHHCQSFETLFSHLMKGHGKNDVVAALLKLIEQVNHDMFVVGEDKPKGECA